MKLPYRKNVVGIIMNSDNEILLLRKKDFDFWQFVQGGVDNEETFEETLKREIFEEIGLNGFEIVKKLDVIFQYDWPKELQEQKGFQGQRQNFFLVNLKVENQDIILSEEDELEEYKWVGLDEVENFVSDNYKETWSKLRGGIKE